ncbi:MAG: hypothetical protein HOY76_25810 [Streptomyces sp.]|nr:hypothetical protein [Streptomyces sp.]
MNFAAPLSALFPGTSGRLLTTLADHHRTDAARPLPLAELSKSAAVTATQLEAALFRLGLLGLVAPRRKGEAVQLVPGHVAWGALRQLADLRGSVIALVREEVRVRLRPAPRYLALTGPVAEGTATHAADVLELVVVPPSAVEADWHDRLTALVADLSRDLGNVVVHRVAGDMTQAEAEAMGPNAVLVLPAR